MPPETTNGELCSWTHEEYEADTSRVRSTWLKKMISDQGPRAYYLNYVNPVPELDVEHDVYGAIQPKVNDLVMGILLHEFAFGGVVNWFICKERRGTNRWHDAVEEHDGQWALKPKQDAELRAWRESMMRNREVRQLIESNSFHEQSFTFECFGIPAKSRVDLLGYNGAIWDLKSTRHTTRKQFENDIEKLRYDFSAAFQELARNSVPEYSDLVAPYNHIVLCKSYPYYCYVWPLERSWIRLGMGHLDWAFRWLRRCLDDQESSDDPLDAWPDLQEAKQVDELPPPDWVLSKHGVNPDVW